MTEVFNRCPQTAGAEVSGALLDLELVLLLVLMVMVLVLRALLLLMLEYTVS